MKFVSTFCCQCLYFEKLGKFIVLQIFFSVDFSDMKNMVKTEETNTKKYREYR